MKPNIPQTQHEHVTFSSWHCPHWLALAISQASAVTLTEASLKLRRNKAYCPFRISPTYIRRSARRRTRLTPSVFCSRLRTTSLLRTQSVHSRLSTHKQPVYGRRQEHCVRPSSHTIVTSELRFIYLEIRAKVQFRGDQPLNATFTVFSTYIAKLKVIAARSNRMGGLAA